MDGSSSRGRTREASVLSKGTAAVNLLAFILAETLLEDVSGAALLLGLGLLQVGIWLSLRVRGMGFHAGECLFLALALAAGAVLRVSGVAYPRVTGMEACLLAAVLISSLIGYPLVGNLLKRSIGITARAEVQRRVSAVLLTILVLHMVLTQLVGLLLPGAGWVVPLIALPPAMVVAVLAVRGRAGGRTAADSGSGCGAETAVRVEARRSDGEWVQFLLGSEPIGSCRMSSGRICDIEELRVDEVCHTGEILHALECLCIGEGARTVRIAGAVSGESWDEELRAAGFLELDGGWRKVIPLTSCRPVRHATK